MTTGKGPIPIREFVALEREARKALRQGDFASIDRINERMADVNARLDAHDGKLYIRTLTAPTEAPDHATD